MSHDENGITKWFAGKCINDPLTYPDKAKWMECAVKFSYAEAANSCIFVALLLVFSIIFIAVGAIKNDGAHWWAGVGMGVFAMFVACGIIFSYKTHMVRASHTWDIAEEKIRSYTPDVIDETYFVNYSKYDATKQSEVKAKWVAGAAKVREAKNEAAKIDAAKTQADGAKNVGWASMAHVAAGVLNTLNSRKK